MFDIGFSELMVIGVVALIVFGPEKLPRVVRTLGHLFGRMQRYVNDVKADINREIELEELRKFKTEFEQAASGVENSIRSELAKTESTFTDIANEAASVPEALAKAAEGGASASAETPVVVETPAAPMPSADASAAAGPPPKQTV